MPRVSFTSQYKSADDVDRFPKYKLGIGEKSRIWMPQDPWMEYYHRIEAPLIEDGDVVMEVKDGKNGPYEARKMQWIGNVFCLGLTGTPGEPGPLMLTGIDAENCPACESAAAQTGVQAPQQRFAANIVKYKVKGRGQNPYALVTPVTGEILVWAYTGRQHGMLHDLGARFGDLRKLDVTVDLEDTPGADKYQKIKQLSVIPDPAWKDPKVRAYITDLWKNNPENRATDEQLRDACLGRDVPRLVMTDMVRRAERQWAQAEQAGSGGGDSQVADAGFNGNLSEGIDSLLADHPGGTEEFMSEQEKQAQFAAIEEAKQQAQREVTQIVSPDDPFGDETPTVPAATTTGTSAPAAGSPSRTAPKPAQSAPASDGPLPDDERARAVEEAADDMFGEPAGDSAPPEPAKAANGGKGKKAAKTEEPRAEEPSLDAPEPAAAPAGKGGVIDFDDLFN